MKRRTLDILFSVGGLGLAVLANKIFLIVIPPAFAGEPADISDPASRHGAMKNRQTRHRLLGPVRCLRNPE